MNDTDALLIEMFPDDASSLDPQNRFEESVVLLRLLIYEECKCGGRPLPGGLCKLIRGFLDRHSVPHYEPCNCQE